MPPWPPDAACNSYQHDRSLTDQQRTDLLAWIADGAPEGDPADAPPLPPVPDTPVRLLIGPNNTAGQGYRWQGRTRRAARQAQT